MIYIYINDFVHLVLQLVEHVEWERIFGLVLVMAISAADSATRSSRVALCITCCHVCLAFALFIRILIARMRLEVELDLITFVAVPLVVVDHASRVAGEEELVFLREPYASHSGTVIIQNVDRARRLPLIQFKDTNLVVLISTDVEVDVLLLALVMEVCK